MTWVKHDPNEIQFSEQDGFSVNCARISADVANALFCTGRARLSIAAYDEMVALGYCDALNDPADLERVLAGWSSSSGTEVQKDWIRGNGIQPGPRGAPGGESELEGGAR